MSNKQKPSCDRAANSDFSSWVVTRRDVLKATGFAAAGLMTGVRLAHADPAEKDSPKPMLRFGMVTDLHYADCPTRGSRHYKQSLTKLAECIDLMNKEKVDFLIELGDFKDQGNPKNEKDTLTYLQTIEKEFCKFEGLRYHVLGNHDMDSISKPQFLKLVSNTNIDPKASYYSFDCKGLHLVVLDANYTGKGLDYDHGNFNWTDANIPPEQLDWLARDLKTTGKPVVVFVHQLLDGKGAQYINNAEQVRKVLRDSKRVLATFSGHHHPGGYSQIEGIHHYTLKAVVEGDGEKNSSYAIVEVYPDSRIIVTGYRKAVGMNPLGTLSVIPAQAGSQK